MSQMIPGRLHFVVAAAAAGLIVCSMLSECSGKWHIHSVLCAIVRIDYYYIRYSVINLSSFVECIWRRRHASVASI